MREKYIDDILMHGYGLIFASYRKTDEKPKKSYDSGGLLNDSKYMISITWNAPVETFAKPSNFFNQHSVNYVMMGTHKAFTF